MTVPGIPQYTGQATNSSVNGFVSGVNPIVETRAAETPIVETHTREARNELEHLFLESAQELLASQPMLLSSILQNTPAALQNWLPLQTSDSPHRLWSAATEQALQRLNPGKTRYETHTDWH